MAVLSPVLIHAIESFQHGIEHYLEGTSKSRKFALLHVDQGIELILKEKVALCGKGIYKQDGQTLSLHEALNSLEKENINIPEKPRIQEIHDLRNTIQHKGLIPDEFTTQFNIENGYKFFKRFATEEIGINFNDVLTQKYINLMEGKPAFEIPDIREDLKATKFIDSPVEKVIKAYTVLEHLAKVVQDSDSNIKGMKKALKVLALENGESEDKVSYLVDSIQKFRSKVVHSDYIPTENELSKFMNHVGHLLRIIGAFEKK